MSDSDFYGFVELSDLLEKYAETAENILEEQEKIADDFLSYLKQHIKPEQNVDLIRFWAGEYDRTLKSRRIHIAEIESHHLESLQNEQYICVAFV